MQQEGEPTHEVSHWELAPDLAVRACFERLRHRRDDIADALGGRPLRVRLDLGAPLLTYCITFTREGRVMTRSGPEFKPHLEIHGPPVAVGRFLVGDMTMSDATFEGLITLNVPSSEAVEFCQLRALVAEELVGETVQAAPGGI